MAVNIKSAITIVFLFFMTDYAFAIDPVYEGPNGIQAKVFATNCLQCHSSNRTGGDRRGAPSSINFDTYEAAVTNLSDAISEAVTDTAMPPSRSGISPLNDEQANALLAWQSAGSPKASAVATTPSIALNGSLLTISLTAGALEQQNADWWVVAITPWGHFYYYVYPNQWVDIGTSLSGVIPAYQGPLKNVSGVTLFDATGIPSGVYTIYFGVDTNQNGVLDRESLYYSSFNLNAP